MRGLRHSSRIGIYFNVDIGAVEGGVFVVDSRVEVAGGRFTVEPWGPWTFLISSALVEVADGCGYVVSTTFDVRSEDAGVMETAFIGPDGERSWSPRELGQWREAIDETEQRPRTRTPGIRVVSGVSCVLGALRPVCGIPGRAPRRATIRPAGA